MCLSYMQLLTIFYDILPVKVEFIWGNLGCKIFVKSIDLIMILNLFFNPPSGYALLKALIFMIFIWRFPISEKDILLILELTKKIVLFAFHCFLPLKNKTSFHVTSWIWDEIESLRMCVFNLEWNFVIERC